MLESDGDNKKFKFSTVNRHKSTYAFAGYINIDELYSISTNNESTGRMSNLKQ